MLRILILTKPRAEKVWRNKLPGEKKNKKKNCMTSKFDDHSDLASLQYECQYCSYDWRIVFWSWLCFAHICDSLNVIKVVLLWFYPSFLPSSLPPSLPSFSSFIVTLNIIALEISTYTTGLGMFEFFSHLKSTLCKSIICSLQWL